MTGNGPNPTALVMSHAAAELPRFSDRAAGEAAPLRTGLAIPFILLGAFLTGYQAFRIGDINVTLADLAFGAALGICIWNGQITTRPFRVMTPLWLISLALIFTGLLIGSVVNGELVRWAVVSVQYLFGYLFLPAMLLAQPALLARKIVLAFILGMVVLETFGIVVSLTMDHAQATSMFTAEFISGNGRVSSFAAEPNWNGQLIAMTFPLLICSFAKRMLPLWGFVVAALILVWGLLLCASFTGFVATCISVAITLLFIGIRHFLAALALVIFAASLYFAGGGALPVVFEKRVAGALVEGDIEEAGTFTGRVQLVRLAWEDAENTILIGHGVDGFRKTNDIQQPVHNLFLLMLVDGGFLSFLGLGLMAVALVGMPLVHRSASGTARGAALAVVVVFLIYTQSNPQMFSRLNISPVIFALILLYVGDRHATRKA